MAKPELRSIASVQARLGIHQLVWIAGIAALDEEQFGKFLPLENLRLRKGIVVREFARLLAAALHRLKNKHIPSDVLVDQIQARAADGAGGRARP